MSTFIHLRFLQLKKLVLIVLIIFTVSLEVNAGNQPPDPGGSPISGGGTPVGGGAPIGNGIYILLGAAAAYSLWKMQKTQKEKNSIQQ